MFTANDSKEKSQRVYFNWKYRWYHLTNFGSTVNGRPWITNPFLVNLDLDSSDFKSNESKIQIWICQKEREIRFKIYPYSVALEM